MKYAFLLSATLVFLIVSCKKEKTSWDTDWSAPLVHGQLTLNDLIPAEYTTTNADNYISIVYNKSLYSFSIDTLINLPDTTISKKTAVNFPNLTVNPGFTYGDVYDQAYNLDQIELKRVIVKSGEVEMTIRSPWSGKSTITFSFPKILVQGSPFVKSFDMDAGTQANPAIQSDVINVAGYDFDLTGLSGNLVNTISGDIIVGSNEAVSSFDITNYDSIEYDITFSNLRPDYAKGYFGSYILSDTTGFDLPFMDAVLAGTIDIDSIDFTISILNGFNLLAQAKITQLKGVSSITGGTTQLNFPLLNTSMNINPASGNMWNWVSSEFPINISNSNSNIASFIENLSDSIYLGYELQINPFGNITAGSDELFPGSTMEIVLNGEFPLDVGANNLTLTDTFDISYSGSSSYTGQRAIMDLAYKNGFPLGATATLYLLDENLVVIDSIVGNTAIQSGMYNSGTYTTSTSSGNVLFDLDAAAISNLELASKIAMIVSFTTDNGQKAKVDANAFFDFNLRSNLQISIHL